MCLALACNHDVPGHGGSCPPGVLSSVQDCVVHRTPDADYTALRNGSVKAAADRRRQEQMAKVKVEKKQKAARGTEVGGFEAHTKGAPIAPRPALRFS